MKTMKRWGWALAVMAGVLALSFPVDAKPSMSHDGASHRLTRRGAAGHIAVRSGRKNFPENAEVSIERARPDDVKHKIRKGWKKRHHGGRGSDRTPNVLASYDISIRHGGKKWQPDAGDPVRVTVELDSPVTCAAGTQLAVVHLADDGTLEELDSSRYGFVLDATKTAVTAFWFDATGFSVYAITEENGTYTPNRRLYDFYSLDFDTTSPTYNTYVPRYFTTVEGNKTFRQIVKSGELLVRPEVLPSPLGRTFIGWFLYDEDKANTTEDGVEYDEEGYAKTKFDFTQPIVFADTPDGDGEVHGAREYVLRARFAHEGYVIFHEQPVGNDWPITAVRRAVLEEVVEGGVTSMVGTVRIDDLKVTYDDSDDPNSQHEHSTPRMIFRGWSETPVMPGALTDTNGNAVVILQNPYVRRRAIDAEALPRDLYPVFVNINWLTFHAAETGTGATYIPPRYFYQDEGTNKFPVSARTGYIFNGWWTTSNDVAGVTGVQVATASGALRTNFSASDLNAIGAWGGKIENGNLMLTNNVTLYGRWNMGQAKYTVVVLRQSLNDKKDTVNKSYDFAFSVTNSAQTESSVSVADAFTKLTTTVPSSMNQGQNNVKTADFKGFYYSHCDDAQTVKGNGTTVLRVYYDRYKVTYSFNSYNNSSDTYYTYTMSTAEPYIYTASDLDYHTYTATSTATSVIVDGNYLYTESGYTSNDNGVSSPNSAASGTFYGLIDGRFSRVYSVKSGNTYYWSTSQNSSNTSYRYKNGTVYTRSAYEQLYGTDGSDYFELTYSNNAWKNSETDETYTGMLYTRKTMTETVYGTENGDSPYDTTPFVVSYEDGNWVTNGAAYKGTRYTREVNDVGDLYGTRNEASPYTSTPFRIYLVDGVWRESNDASGAEYTGTRYTRTSNDSSRWRPLTSLPNPTMTGLYGQPLSMYGYEWPAAQSWQENYSNGSGSGTTMTYLDSFNAISSARTSTSGTTITTPFYTSGSSGSYNIYHVLQDLNGNFNMTNAIQTKRSGSATFNFSNKFEGFTVYAYSTGSFTDSPSNLVNDGDSQNTGNGDFYVYHTRNKYTITFVDSYNLTQYKIEELYYGAPLGATTNNLPTCRPTEASMQAGYSFTGWYSDQATSTKFNFNTTMPRNNLIAYAGWETEWYLIKIDPNYGKLPGGQSTWFWEPYNGDPIEEYSATTRSYVESINGTWFYAIKNRDYYGYSDEYVEGEAADRGAYYTQDQSDPAIVQNGKRYSPAVNVYRYSGWYEVDPDTGEETLYAFGQPVQHNTTLRLHWKHIGIYHLYYDPGEGTMSDGDENETTFKVLDAGAYADSSDVLVTRTAVPPQGYTFSGWKIRYGDGEVLHPGQEFFFNSAYTVTALDANGNPIKRLILDAVYDKVSTVSLTTDANGGTLDPTLAIDATLAYPNAPTLITNVTETTRTVSGMRNNAFGTLSDGTGYTCVVKDENGNDVQLDFVGWNTKADGTGTHFDGGAFVGLDTIDTPDENGANTLYAEWAVKVYFDKANDNVQDWKDAEWTAKGYQWDADRQQYYQITTLNGYATYPDIVFDPVVHNQMFVFWSTNRYTDASLLQPHDFSQPVTGPMTLYARYSDLIEVEFHAVDATGSTNVLKDDEWVVGGNNVFKIGNYTNVSFTDAPTDYVVAPEEYDYAFTCVATGKDSISEAKKINRLFFNSAHDIRAVYIEYADGTQAPLESGMEIYVVYFQNPRPIDIAYVAMQENGNLLLTSEEQVHASVTTNAWNMADTVTNPLAPNSEYSYYAFAIGEPGAENGSQLHFITDAKSNNNDKPQLQLRNTWQGIEYSIDGGTTWHHYGSNAELYVVYFKSQPTIINFFEQTVGTADDMATEFEYVVTVSNVVKTVTQQRTRTLSTSNTSPTYYYGYRNYPYSYKYNNKTYYYGANNIDWDSWSTVTAAGSNTLSEEASTSTHTLSNGGTDAITLFASVVGPGNWANGGTNATTHTTSGYNSATYLDLTETQVRTVVTNLQTVVIRQVPKDGFTTTNDNGDGAFVYTATSTPTPSSSSVTYTNTRDGLPVELHVAVTKDGGFVNGDGDYRSTTTNDYTVTVPISTDGTSSVTSDDLASKTNTIFKTEMDEDSRFMGVYYGKTNENGVVTFEGEVTSVGFVKPENSEYYALCLNNDPTIPFDDYQIYCVYCEMPRIYYVATGANGALTKRDPVTFEGAPVSMGNAGEAAATQGTLLEVGMDAASKVAVGAGSDRFAVPMVLDGADAGSLSQVAFGFGAADVASTNSMDGVTHVSSVQLKIVDMALKWSADGANWGTFTGKPAVYVIYKEAGHDLTINANSLASNDDKANDTFTVTISSENLVDGVPYVITGYVDSNGDPIETVTPVNGVITLTLKSGDAVTIQSLQDNGTSPYVIKQTPNADDYAQEVLVDGKAPLSPGDDGSVAIFLERDRVVDFTNTKSYTVSFVDENGTEISSDKVPYGTTPSELTSGVEDPAKPMDETSIYRFDGWGPTVEPVGSNTVYTAGYTEIKIPQATQRQDDTNVVVNLNKEDPQQNQEALVEALKEVGIDVLSDDYSEEAANEILNTVDPNGMRHWENLVTGSDTNALALSTASGEDDEATFHLTAGSDGGKYVDLGYIVLHDLRKLEDGRWNRKDGPKAGANPDFTIRLLDDEGRSIGATGLYRVYTLIIPKHDLAITNEIPSTNIVGVLEIESTMTNTLAAVPWHMLASDPAVPTNISVSAWVQTNQLAGATYVRALDAAGDYQMWQLSDDTWMPFTTTRSRNGGMVSVEAEDAFSRRLRRGEPVWLTRTDVSKGSFFLIGQFSPDSVTEDIAGGDDKSLTPTLLTNPTFLPMVVNELTWEGTPDSGDQIAIPTEDGTPTLLTWNGLNWGAAALEHYEKNGRMRTRVVRKTDFTIPPGRGFWYHRKAAGALSVTFPAIPCN